MSADCVLNNWRVDVASGSEYFPVNYGLLYNWYAASDPRNICSEGWHIPTFEDAMELGANTGAIWDEEEGCYPTGGEKFKEEFTYPDTCGEGYAWDCCMGMTAHTNEFAFNARGCGQRQCDAPPYDFTSKRESSIYIIIDNFDIFCGHFAVYCGDDSFYVGGTEKFKGHSIRPVKDYTTLTHGQSGTYTDPSGYTYRTICIGAQEWVADSIRTMHYRTGDPIPEVTDRIEWAALITGALCAYDNDWNNV